MARSDISLAGVLLVRYVQTHRATSIPCGVDAIVRVIVSASYAVLSVVCRFAVIIGGLFQEHCSDTMQK